VQFLTLIQCPVPSNFRFEKSMKGLNIGKVSFSSCSSFMHLLVTVMGWYHTKRFLHCDRFLIYCASPSEY
jgi:hypothetical protein